MLGFKTKPAPNSALISVRLKKINETLASDRRERDSLLTNRKDVLLRGSDQEVAEYDATVLSKIDELGRKIADAEYMIPVLKEELRIATDRERKAAIEEECRNGYDAAKSQLDAFNKKLGKDVAQAMALLVAIVQEEKRLHDLIAQVNGHLPEGATPLDRPGRSVRFSDAPPSGAPRMVKHGRLKDPNNRVRMGGDEAYETFVGPERDSGIDAPRAFDPPPLFRTMEIPALRKGDPEYRIPFHLKMT
jgi:hypothetical protein